jgi:ABC-type sugar transport system permease subunit
MTTKRILLSTLAAFVVSQVLAVLVHGFILAADYEPYDGTLLRSGADAWQFIFLPFAHLSFICGMMWVYTHTPPTGSTIRQGVFLGFLAWLMGQVPLWLIWYAEQPWPGSLVIKQLGLELVSSILIGLTIAITAPRRAMRSQMKMSPGEDSAAAALAAR